MAKGKKIKKTKKQTPTPKPEKIMFENIKPWQKLFIAVVIIIIATFVFLSDLTFKGLSPAGSDVIASKGKTHLMLKYEKELKEISLWNPAIFCGTPSYHRDKPRAWSLDTFASYFFNDNSGQVVVYYIIGAVGMFLLLYSLNFSILTSLFGALAFLLMSHYNSLWLEGHFSKFRAVMYIPWVLASFLYFLNKKNLLATLLFALAFTLQIRTQHYQIIFYTILILITFGIYPLIKLLIEKKLKDFLKLTSLFLLGTIITILAVYQPIFVINEYAPYSTRGGNPINIEKIDQSAEKAKGVSFQYATRWSLSPKEMICFLIPRYFGGTSHEQYNGDAVPQLKGYAIPGYWGDMPFTGSTDYIGVALFILLVIGIYGFRRDWRVKSLLIFTIFALLLAFGRHFPFFYKILFYYLPFFSKFRVPTMIMMAVFVVFVIFAVFGIQYLIQCYKKEDKKIYTVFYIIAGVLFFLTMSPFILKGSLSFSTPQDANLYDPQVLKLIKDARFDLMKIDALRTLLFSILVLGSIFIFLKRYISTNVFLLLVTGLMIIDILLVNYRFFDSLVNKEFIEERHFVPTKIDQYLLYQQDQNPEPFRILGIGALFNNNDLAYNHQCIGGYDPAKLQLIQDIIDNNLFRSWDMKLPINWHVVNFLNGKFFISEKQLSHVNLKQIIKDDKKNLFLYENVSVLPRCFLVGNYKMYQDPADILKTLNHEEFNPLTKALLDKELPAPIAQPDSLSYAKVTLFTPNKIEIEAKTSHQCLLVLSEVYYPKGWRAYVGTKETPIYKTNHILRSIVIPEGEHKVKFVFYPDTYFRAKFIATIANAILLICVVLLGALTFIKNKK